MRRLGPPTDGIGDKHPLVTVFQCLDGCKREADLGVKSTEDQPLAPGLLYGFTEGAILECVHRRAVDHLKARKLGEDRAFREAVKKTGRKRLIFGGLHTEICLTFATVQALKDGYEAMFVTDAVGGRSQTAHRTAIERLSHAGAVPNTALAVLCELFRDWTSPLADKARAVIAWYFAEIPKLTADVGV